MEEKEDSGFGFQRYSTLKEEGIEGKGQGEKKSGWTLERRFRMQGPEVGYGEG